MQCCTVIVTSVDQDHDKIAQENHIVEYNYVLVLLTLLYKASTCCSMSHTLC